MKPASFLALVVCAPILLTSSIALAAPGKTAKGPKKKPKTADAAPEPVKEEPAPVPVVPETKAADAKPVEIPQPVPVASTTTAPAAADRPAKPRGEDDENDGKAISVAPLFGYGT